MMSEKVYCPKCDAFEIQRTAGVPGERKSTKAAEIFISILGGWVLHRIVFGKKDDDYIPVSYRCLKCGNEFLSMETYEEELEKARNNRICAMIAAGLLALIAFTAGRLAMYLLRIEEPDVIGAVVCFAVAALLVAVGIWLVWCAHQRVNELDQEMFELEQCEFRHRPLY